MGAKGSWSFQDKGITKEDLRNEGRELRMKRRWFAETVTELMRYAQPLEEELWNLFESW